METSVRPPAWLWFNLLSLDAPVVALVWQDFLARCYPATLLLTGRAVLGLTVWAIYLADRLLDIRHPASAEESIRLEFYRRHRPLARTLFAAVAGIDVIVTGLWLRPAVFANGLALSAGVVVYLGAFPFTGWSATAWKKPIAALLFTAGVFLIAWTGSGSHSAELALPAVGFCALCLGNLLMTERWTLQAQSRIAVWLLLGLAFLCLFVPAIWFVAILCSALGLCALAQWGRGISRSTRCALADAMLLTPLLFYLR